MLLVLVFKLGAVALSILISVSTWSSILLHWYSPMQNQNLLYDFIVVGGGSAGSTTAGRLAENGFNILLLEAGGPPPWWATLGTIDIPIFGPLWQHTDLDWAYTTEPQTYSCGALKGRRSLWPRGRVLGGSGRLNNMVYLRGHEKDWEKWGFSLSSQLHYFKKSENQLGKYANDTVHHGSEGWMPVSDIPMTTALSDAVLKAAQELGYFVGDLNSMTHTGFMEVQTTTQQGARFSADCAFLYSGKRSNLHVLTNALVDKVMLSGYKKARGVKFYHVNGWHYARSKHGVILSAGAVGSPKILLQSGIGPADHLLEVGIPVKIASPAVGRNLQDHVSTGSDLILLNSTLALSLSNLAHPKSFWDYATKGKGPLTHGGCEATALLYSPASDPSKEPPDIQLLVLPAGQTFDSGTLLRHNMGVTDEVWEQYFLHKTDSYSPIGVTVLVILLHPRSRGEIKLKSKNPFDAPHIDPKYLADPRDIDTLVAGISTVKKLLQTKAMATLGAHLNLQHMPGCEKHHFDSVEYWECYSRMLTYTVYHPAGTCQMGPKESAVVDHSFRVHGAKNLYVVDASVMPTLPSANINAAVIALAERAADSIMKEVLERDQPHTPQKTYISVMRALQRTNSCRSFVNYTL